jgi:predicted GNAT superfamily acetyltransferase
LHLHSHISGVVSSWQGRHVGLALKQHQRAWALERGLGTIEWTFDPLIRRNAFFNLVKLGADIVGFEPSFYGVMHDAINAGDETDRAVVRWELTSAVAVEAVRGTLDRDTAGTTVLRADDGGGPVVSASSDPILRAWIPVDAVALRQRNPERGRAWREAVRATVGAAVSNGYVACSMSRDGWYTLVRRDR